MTLESLLQGGPYMACSDGVVLGFRREDTALVADVDCGFLGPLVELVDCLVVGFDAGGGENEGLGARGQQREDDGVGFHSGR